MPIYWPYNQDRIDILITMALEHDDFVPIYGKVAIIIPDDSKQFIFIIIPVPYNECEDTA